MRRIHFFFAASLIRTLILCALLSPLAVMAADGSAELPVVRVAALKYGTASWELELLRDRGLDREHGFVLEVLPRVSPNASLIALQGGAADFTVSDWLWAARQREAGRDYRYFPYSTAIGELVVPADTSVTSIAGLKGLTLGVAGGAEDKSWLLLQSYARQTDGLALARETTPRYAAPPLLNALAGKGDIDAVLTYWHYAARLKSAGFKSLISSRAVLDALGIEGDVPMLGWVFSGDYADRYPDRVNAFLRASYAAKKLLQGSDDSWEIVRPLMRVNSEAEFSELKAGYRQGVPQAFGDREIAAINRVADIVRASSPPGRYRVDETAALPDGVFWRGVTLANAP